MLKADAEASEICQAVEDVGLEEVPRLQARLGLLATLGQIAPYMGLLGTVLGMMEILVGLQEKAPLVHAGDLARGLWQALISTAAGLSIAVVAYAAYNLLVGRVEAIILDMERAANEAISFLQQLKHGSGS
ncbi:MAG TPA: MotA/TolQ/ExbB proton channel family protein [Lentisphaerae bacterium]|nr:MotA/TolQ/ExbB proton channel family protein [Lentisphaerota bacterium]